MKNMISIAATMAIAGAANAAVVTQWTFNNATLNTLNLDPNIGSGTASYVGGTSANTTGTAAGWVDDTTAVAPIVNYRWTMTNFSTIVSESGKRGAEFATSTAGNDSIVVSFGIRFSNTASKYGRFQVSIDGSTFTDFGSTIVATGGDVWNSFTFDLASVAGVENNANFKFRVVAIVNPDTGSWAAARSSSTFAATGTWGFDLVNVNGNAIIPAPGAIALLGAAGLVGARRRR